MALQKQAPVTADAFEAFMARPENADRLFELINGEIIEKMPSNPHASEIAQLIAFSSVCICVSIKLPGM